ncbi:hypothetical protein IW261DRAFT_5001 [Armillaria novae-zelandiae]|uniref:Uncharacterized protein n=1 Tax=Armillaria novae-zelandiae TaxID=153914 RepID=A0AA39PWA2_9AGAR|nr:hypothetical protein IW261DRAFT_5001 [Armillaria novae-zelandiae]
MRLPPSWVLAFIPIVSPVSHWRALPFGLFSLASMRMSAIHYTIVYPLVDELGVPEERIQCLLGSKNLIPGDSMTPSPPTSWKCPMVSLTSVKLTRETISLSTTQGMAPTTTVQAILSDLNTIMILVPSITMARMTTGNRLYASLYKLARRYEVGVVCCIIHPVKASFWILEMTAYPIVCLPRITRASERRQT